LPADITVERGYRALAGIAIARCAGLTIDPSCLLFIVNSLGLSLGNFYIKKTMALSIGSKAPVFALSTKDASGIRLIKLSDNFGKTNTLLLFFPAAFTSVCTAEMCDLTEEFGTYEGLNTTVFGLSGDSPFALEAWANQEKIRIPLLSDYDHSVARAYGVAYDSFLPEANLPLSGVAKRSAFIVDRNGVIQYAESSDNPKQLPNFDAIKARLKELA
jgi:peroxiredoxin